MAENKNDKDLTVEKEVTISKDKPTEQTGEQTAAPVTDKPVEAPDAEDFSAVINVLNAVDKDVLSGMGEITDIPDQAKAPIKYIVEQLVFMRDLYEDPLWTKIMDDLVDQKEDGKTPSILVAFARNVPMGELEALSDNEDYTGAQQDLSDRLAKEKADADAMAADEAALVETLEKSKANGRAYGERIGYSEEEINNMFSDMLKFMQLIGDGEISEKDWEDYDKMRNYDADTKDLRGQIETLTAGKPPKEMLPDQASVESVVAEKKQAPRPPVNQPGMASMMDQPVTTDYANRPRK